MGYQRNIDATQTIAATNASDHTSITNQFYLFGVFFNKPQMTKQDKAALDAAEEAMHVSHRAKGKSGKFIKNLYPKAQLDPIISFENRVRQWVRNLSVTAWGGPRSSLYLLPAANMFAVTADRGPLEVEYDQLKTRFGQQYLNTIAQQRDELGDLFDPEAYPDVHYVLDQFRMTIMLLPVSLDIQQAFSTLEDDIREEAEAMAQQSANENLRRATEEPLTRLLEAVANIADKLSREDSRVHHSLMEELDYITGMIPHMNVLGIPEINDLARNIRQSMLVHIESVKDKESPKRKEVADAARKVLTDAGVPATADLKDKEDRAEAAKDAAANILAQMKGFF